MVAPNAVRGFVGIGKDDGYMQKVAVTGIRIDKTSPWELGYEWLTGTGPRESF